MRLLCVSYAFPPLLAAQSAQVARLLGYLSRQGHSVTVLAARPEHTGYPLDSGLEALVPPGMAVRRTASLEGRLLGRLLMAAGAPDAKALWGLTALPMAQRLAAGGSFDAVCTFAQPFTVHLLGLRLFRRTRLPWLAHFSDPWADNPYHRVYGSWHRWVQGILERRVIAKADRVVVVSATYADQLAARYDPGLRERLVILPHAYDAGAYPPKRPGDAGAFVVAHVGHLYGPRTMEPLLQAAAGLREAGARDWLLQLVGGWPPSLPVRVRELGLHDHVKLIGPVGYHESLRWMEAADLLVVIDAPTAGGSPFLPSKLVEYLGTGRPVLGITPPASETARVLARLGLSARAPDDIAGIRALLADAIAGRVLPPAVPPPAEYSIDALGKQYEEVLLALVKAPRGHDR